MAKLYGEIAAKALLTLDKSFARANGQPLDASEVYYSLQAAKDYAATAQAYIGQKIVVIENGVVTHYSVEDTAGTLKELGAKPVADGTTVAIGADGKITLANIAETNKTGTYNAVLVNGKLTWVKPSETTVEGLDALIKALTGRVDNIEDSIESINFDLENIWSEIGEPANEEEGSDAQGLYALIADEEARAKAAEKALGERIDAIDFIDEDELDARFDELGTLASLSLDSKEKILVIREDDNTLTASLSLKYDSGNKKIQLLGDEDELVSEIDATAFIKDGMINTVELVTEKPIPESEEKEIGNWLKITFNTDAKEEDIYLDVSELIDVYTAGNGLNLTDGKFSVKLATGSESFLTVTADGVKLAGVKTAINTAKQEAIDAAAEYVNGAFTDGVYESINDLDERVVVLEEIDHSVYATKAELEAHEEAAAAAYATKDYVGVIPTGYTETNVVAYVNKKAEEVLSQATGGSSESAASVKAQLDTYKSENAPKFEKLEGIEAGAQVNVIEEVVAAEGAKISVSTSDKKVTVNDKALVDLIAAAQKAGDDAAQAANNAQGTANEAKQAATENAAAIGNINTTLKSHGDSIADYSTRITNLEQADIAHAAEYSTLAGLVSGHTDAIAKKADATALDAVSSRVSTNESDIKTLKETTIPAINESIGKKANAADVYTKTEIGTITDGMTLIEMVNDTVMNSMYDDTDVLDAIGNNKSAIETIYKVEGETKSGVLVTEIARVEGLVSAETTRATEVEADFKSRIETMEDFWKAADDNNAIDKLAEIVAYIESDKSGALNMAADIQANTDAIKAIYFRDESDNESGLLVTEVKALQDQITENAQTIEFIQNNDLPALEQAIEDAIAGIPAATAKTLGLVKVDDVTIKAEAGVIGVKSVSTDLLVQGTEEFILNGGTAAN